MIDIILPYIEFLYMVTVILIAVIILKRYNDVLKPKPIITPEEKINLQIALQNTNELFKIIDTMIGHNLVDRMVKLEITGKMDDVRREVLSSDNIIKEISSDVYQNLKKDIFQNKQTILTDEGLIKYIQKRTTTIILEYTKSMIGR